MKFTKLFLLSGALVAAGGLPTRTAAAQGAKPGYLDETKSFESRAADLVSRMTLEEKANQMKDQAPAIERLGVPAYGWWNEALHGVARDGLGTVFPQAIGFAATWNDSLIFRMSTAISDEIRAKHQEHLRKDQHGRYQGLTIWSPNINIFRDPRWGRGQETYGEDPFLTGSIAVPFIRGLQGDDPKYFKTISTVKHFAVHSGPEPDRHTFDAVVSERDLRETYLPQFEMGIRDAGAYSLMCAYNAFRGQAACASDHLERDILRGEWKFPGYIVSDCGAIDDIYLRHKVVPTAAAASAIAVKTGTDLDCGRVYPNLVDAVKQGLITEAQIDSSLRRLYLARLRLGMFDDPSHVKWAQIPFSTVDSPEHKELAREVARESIVLLKNEKNTLPLRKNLGTIAVIGPNADQKVMLLGNYNGNPSDPVTPLRGIREAVSPGTKVLYARGSDLADNFPVLDVAATDVLTTPEGKRGLRVEFFENSRLEGVARYTMTDSMANASFGLGAPFNLNPDDFSMRWSGFFKPQRSGTYRLALNGTMRFTLYLNDSAIVRSYGGFGGRGGGAPPAGGGAGRAGGAGTPPAGGGATAAIAAGGTQNAFAFGEAAEARLVQSPPLQLDAGKTYAIRIEGQETSGDAQLQLLASAPAEVLGEEALKAAQQADAVVLVLGLTARLEGEEMNVQVDGFKGGDRTRIDLPTAQEAILEKITALGKPTVLVLLNGSALAVNWAQEHVPAIVEGWYPGQAGGQALADVLFGDYSPAGRLPVTFYRDTTDLPPFSEYKMEGRTYRYCKGKALYPFGHGLSYTSFGYRNLRTSAASISAGGKVTVSVDVTNTGKRSGDEVVQMYTSYPKSNVPRAIRDLRGFQRISLRPGQTKTVSFALPASRLAYWDEKSNGWKLEDAPVEIQVGASSADIRQKTSLRVSPK